MPLRVERFSAAASRWVDSQPVRPSDDARVFVHNESRVKNSTYLIQCKRDDSGSVIYIATRRLGVAMSFGRFSDVEQDGMSVFAKLRRGSMPIVLELVPNAGILSPRTNEPVTRRFRFTHV